MGTVSLAVRVVFLLMLSGLGCQGQALWPVDSAAYQRDRQLCEDALVNSGLDNHTAWALTREFHIMRPIGIDLDLICNHARETAAYRECREDAWRRNLAEEDRGLVSSPGAYTAALSLLCQNRDMDRGCLSNITLVMQLCQGNFLSVDADYNSMDHAEQFCSLKRSPMPCLDKVLQLCPEKTRHVINQYQDIILPPTCRQISSTTSGTGDTSTFSGSGSYVISVTSVLLACALAMSLWLEESCC